MLSNFRMNCTPLFSVCIPVYNAERTLEECIESVISQHFNSYEIILIDDGSTDRSGAICDKYVSKYPEIIHVVHKSNEGLLQARRDGIRNSAGAYLLFLDADDVYCKDTFSRLHNIIAEHRADMVIFELKIVNPDGRTILPDFSFLSNTVFQGSNKKALYYKAVVEKKLNNLVRKCIHRSLIVQEESFEAYGKLQQGEDYLQSLPYFERAKKVVYIRDCLYEYRLNANSITHTVTLANYKDLQKVYKVEDQYIHRWRFSSEEIALVMRNRIVGAIRCIEAMVRRNRIHNALKNEFKNTIMYISDDPEYQRAYRIGFTHLTIYQKFVSSLIIQRRALGVITVVRLANFIRNLKR